MRVLLINSDSGFGSTGRIVNDLHNALVERGHICLIGFGRENNGENVNAIRIGNKLDVYFHALLSGVFDLQGFGSLNATKKFIKIADRFSPDIIHLHNIHGSYINIEILFDWLKRIEKPVIWTLHDCWTFTGHCSNYTLVNCEKWKTGCKHCEQKNEYPASILDRSSRNYVLKREIFNRLPNLTITTVSNWLGEQVKQSFLKDYDIKIIPNGVNLDVFKPTKSNFRKKNKLEDKTVLLGVSSIWNDRKGLWLFNELADKFDEKFKIVLVGITKKQKKRLSKKILTIERTQNAYELAEIYTSADIFLNPSVEESFGLVSLEALACGTRVISNRFSANPELIKEKCGVIVSDITSELFLKAIKEMQHQPKNKDDCIARARQYDKEKQLNEYLDLYGDVMK